MMKKILWTFLALCILLSGCAASSDESASEGTAKPPAQSDDAAVESAIRIAYYEQLVQDKNFPQGTIFDWRAL